MASNQGETSSGSEHPQTKKPICIVVVGLAGSGKTTFIKMLVSYLTQLNNKPFVMNLDPACVKIPYPCNIDIRNNVDYKEIMRKYNQGPNGAIITSLNFFATVFNQVIEILEKNTAKYEYIIIDTPGQLEVFKWSASGSIIVNSLASTFPTVLTYVMDTPRSRNPNTFVTNMLYACSHLFKFKIPVLLAMNKIDIESHEFAINWMSDFENFEQDESVASYQGYNQALLLRMNMVLQEFYEKLHCVGVSSKDGTGVPSFFVALKQCAKEYEEIYLPEFKRLKKTQLEKEEKEKKDVLEKLKVSQKVPQKDVVVEEEEIYLDLYADGDDPDEKEVEQDHDED